jgi:hypothetical protein
MRICPYCSKPITEERYSYIKNADLVSTCLDCGIGWINNVLFVRMNDNVNGWHIIEGQLLVKQEIPEV